MIGDTVVGEGSQTVTTEKHARRIGRVRSRVFIGASVLLALMMLTCEVGLAASKVSAKRQESDEIVKEAEAIILEAGKKDKLDQDMVKRAINDLRQALKIDPRNDTAFVDLGFCYGMLQDSKTAADMYRAAAKINPSADNFKELADLFLRTRNFEAALMAANAGLEKNSHDGGLLNAKGLALMGLERNSEAVEAFRQAVHYDPQLEVAQQNLDALTGKGAKSGNRSQ